MINKQNYLNTELFTNHKISILQYLTPIEINVPATLLFLSATAVSGLTT